SLLRVQTFTLAIYQQMSGRFDYQGAAGLSVVLVLLTLSLLVLERYFRRRQRYFTARAGAPARLVHASRGETAIIWGWLGLVALFAFGIPLAWMLTWTARAVAAGAVDAAFWGYARNTFVAAALAG